VYHNARHVSRSYPDQDICPPVTRFVWSRYSRSFENRCNQRHYEFISIFNLIRNSFATIFQPASSPADPLREVDLSLDLFQRPPTSPLSLMAPALPLPLYFPHGASLSLTSLFYLSQPRSHRIVADSPYLLHDLSPVIFVYVVIFSASHTTILICSMKFSSTKWWCLCQIYNSSTRCPWAMIILWSATERFVAFTLLYTKWTDG